MIATLLLAAAALPACEGLYRAGWAARRELAGNAGDGRYFDLYVVGESTAVGEPYAPGIMFSSLVEGMFGGRLRGRELRVFDLARPGESSYPQRERLARALRLRGPGPGAVLVYTGHNDAAVTKGPAWYLALRESALRRSLLFEDLAYFTEEHLPALRTRTPEAYGLNLRRIVEVSLAAGLTPVLATAVSDISDMDPGLFAGNAGDRYAMFRAVEKGLDLERAGRKAEAAAYYAARENGDQRLLPYLEYRRGKCLLAMGRRAEAGTLLRRAVDLAGPDNFGRAGSAQNAMARAVAAEYRVPLVDAVKLFEAASPGGVTGHGLFSDGHHPNMKGYLLLAGAYARELSRVTGDPVRRTYSGPADVFSAMSFGPGQQALALVCSGRWFFSSAARHVLPFERLALARARFREAAALDPGSFSALLGLGLTEAAINTGMLSDDKSLAWLGDEGLFYGGAYSVPPAALPGVLARLAAGGVTDRELAAIRAAYAAANPGK